jgi:hypothetical protein
MDSVRGYSNTSATNLSLLIFEVDLFAPFTTWRQVPATFSNQSLAAFAFDCSTSPCSFTYNFDGGASLTIGGAGGGGGGGSGTSALVNSSVNTATTLTPSRYSVRVFVCVGVGEGGGGGGGWDTVCARECLCRGSCASVCLLHGHDNSMAYWYILGFVPARQASRTAVFGLGMLFNGTLSLPSNSSGNSTVQIRLKDEVTWSDVRTRANFSANATYSLLTLVNVTEGVQTLEARAVKSDGAVDVTPLVRSWTSGSWLGGILLVVYVGLPPDTSSANALVLLSALHPPLCPCSFSNGWWT